MSAHRAGALVFLVLLATALVWVTARPTEPRYQGKRVSLWVRDLQGQGVAARAQAETALREVGTNALPILRRELHVTDSPLKLMALHLLWRQDRIRVRAMLARGWRVRAAQACGVLGPAAQPLIPDLLEMAQGDFVNFEIAVSALSQIGTVAVPQLVPALTNRNARLRQAAARALGAIGPGAREAVPVLTRSLQDPDTPVRVAASAALGAIGVGSPEVVGALAAALADPNEEVRDNLVDALAQLGLPAREAMPALLRLLSDPDDLVRLDATNLLNSLGPAAEVPTPKSKH